jgi:hypothetical protein
MGDRAVIGFKIGDGQSVRGVNLMVERARAYDGCLDFSIIADAVDPERVNLFECWRDQTALNAWRKVARGGPGGKPKAVAVSLYRTTRLKSHSRPR